MSTSELPLPPGRDAGPETQRFPAAPAELWGLWSPGGGEDDRGCWWQHGQTTADGPMAFEGRESAEAGAADESCAHAAIMGEGVALTPVLIGVHPRWRERAGELEAALRAAESALVAAGVETPDPARRFDSRPTPMLAIRIIRDALDGKALVEAPTDA